MKKFLNTHKIILLAAALFTALYNTAFFSQVLNAYPLPKNLMFVISLALVLFCIIGLLLTLLCHRRTTKIILPILFFIAALAAYYMDTFNVVIDKTMLINAAQTNAKEAGDLLTAKLLMYIAFLGVLPRYVFHRLLKVSAPKRTLMQAIGQKTILIVLFLSIAMANIVGLSSHYSSFFREFKSIRFYANPITPIYSSMQFLFKGKKIAPKDAAPLGKDANIPASDVHRELIVIVVGETARWDRFSLNGYGKLTNPLLAQEKVVSFKNFTSCGTSTAVSVPCMFSPFGRKDYSDAKFDASENLIDVLGHADVSVLWRDNNSDSKGVAVRPENVTYEDYKDPKNNTVCDIECRDEGMLVGLQDYIDQHPSGDVTIVLHQMGSHGPAYYKRYPAAFEQFKPACQNTQLNQCSDEEISNAYDNTILYTDYFLSKVIGLLKTNAPKFESAMFYMGDHGESLGENGVYLHGMPYAFAPEAQTHVGAVVWLSDNFDEISFDKLKAAEQQPFSQDNLFHTVLGMMEIETKVYDANKDIFKLTNK